MSDIASITKTAEELEVGESILSTGRDGDPVWRQVKRIELSPFGSRWVFAERPDGSEILRVFAARAPVVVQV